MAHDSKLTLNSEGMLQQMDGSQVTVTEQVSLKEDNSTSGTSPSADKSEQDAQAPQERREETSEKQSLLSDRPFPESVEKEVSVVPPPSLEIMTSVTEKVPGQATVAVLNEAERQAFSLMDEEATETGLEDDSPDSLHSLLNCRICQLFVRTVDRLLDKSEELMDHYMPLTEEEISSLKQAVETLDVPSAEHSKSACLQRITALSSRLRQQAYMMALGKLRVARRNTNSSISQLHHTLDLIEHVQQGQNQESQESHNRLTEMCSQWTQRRGSLPQQQLEEVPMVNCRQVPPTLDSIPVDVGTSLAKSNGTTETSVPSRNDYANDEALMIYTVSGCREEDGFPSTEVESQTLEMSRGLTLDLQGTYESLLANLKDMPLHLKGKLHQTYQHLAELNTRFAVARTFADLSGNILAKGLSIMAEAQESMDEVMAFALQNPTALLAANHPPAAAATETASGQREDILKIQAAYDPKGCENDQ